VIAVAPSGVSVDAFWPGEFDALHATMSAHTPVAILAPVARVILRAVDSMVGSPVFDVEGTFTRDARGEAAA
jgi:hypothetical protein